MLPAITGVDFDLGAGETLGIVGESGAGKSTVGLALVRLLPTSATYSGSAAFEGVDVLSLPLTQLRAIRGARIGVAFQDRTGSLHPLLPIDVQVMEGPHLHLGLSRRAARERAVVVLESVGIPASRSRDYPHQLSGGMRQRVLLAIAISCAPEILIADEPTSALDVVLQCQILDLIKQHQAEKGMSVLIMTHDLGVAARADHIVVMYAGRVFESALALELFREPANPYTRALLGSIPDPKRPRGELVQISGRPPDLSRLSADQCPFAERCPEVVSVCREQLPPLKEVTPGHHSRCWRS
ncbi:MAG: ABC transporter ATP-binding protein [Acidobacteria bacterium]|nr:ABC transporter ATP-binding protein [Acidobacteriota bacterium]